MAHPNKSEASEGHNAKLRRMTRHYGSASGPDNNRLAAVEALKDEGPEEHHGFGADYASATPRGDKPARRAVAANPIATYKRGGKACVSPVEVATRARGGRLTGKHKGKGATHVNVIVAPQGQPGGMGPANPQLAALAAGAGPKPPMAPPMAGPPPGGPPMAGPPPGAGGPPMMRKRGGKVHSDEAQDKELIHKVLKSEGLERKRAAGGGIKMPHLTGGGDTGIGRLEKARHQPKLHPKEV